MVLEIDRVSAEYELLDQSPEIAFLFKGKA